MQGCHKGLLALMIAIVMLGSCTAPKPARQITSVEEIRQNLRHSINENNKMASKSNLLPNTVGLALLPPLSTKLPQHRHHRFDISANKMPAKDFFMGLVEGTPYNMVVNPKVSGEISLNLKSVSIEQAMEAVRDVYGYEYRKTSYGYEVLPQELRTQIFNVDYLNIKRTGKSYTKVSSGQISEQASTFSTNGTTTLQVSQPQDKPSGSSVDTQSKMDFWHSLETTLKTLVSITEGRSVVVDGQAGVVIVHAFPDELHRVARYLDSIQSNLSRQVVLEAKILEVQLSHEFESGIDWNLFGRVALGNGGISQISGQTLSDTNFNLDDFNSIFTLAVYGNFGALIKLLQMQGTVQVLSNPRISTVNNQKAVIKVGEDSFFVTGVSTSNTIVGTNTLPSENVNLTPFFSGVTLDVTPQISHDKNIILHIHPTISVVTEQTQNLVLGSTPSATGTTGVNNTFTLPLAHSTIRESDNIVRAKSGQIVVIGGLMQNNMTEQVAGVPFLSRLPLVGPLFRRTQQIAQKSELVILLRPIVVNNQTWGSEMEESERRFSKLDRGFHAGSFPEVFGTEAEKEDRDLFCCDNRA